MSIGSRARQLEASLEDKLRYRSPLGLMRVSPCSMPIASAKGNWHVPLNLYSLGSSFLFGILNDEDALDPAKLDPCDAASDARDGR